MGNETGNGKAKKLFRSRISAAGKELAQDGGRVAKAAAKGLYFLYGRVSVLSEKLATLSGRTDSLKEDVSTLTSTFWEQKARLDAVEESAALVPELKQKADLVTADVAEAKDGVAKLGARVQKVEEGGSQTGQRITDNATAYTRLEKRVGTLEEDAVPRGEIEKAFGEIRRGSVKEFGEVNEAAAGLDTRVKVLETKTSGCEPESGSCYGIPAMKLTIDRLFSEATARLGGDIEAKVETAVKAVLERLGVSAKSTAPANDAPDAAAIEAQKAEEQVKARIAKIKSDIETAFAKLGFDFPEGKELGTKTHAETLGELEVGLNVVLNELEYEIADVNAKNDSMDVSKRIELLESGVKYALEEIADKEAK